MAGFFCYLWSRLPLFHGPWKTTKSTELPNCCSFACLFLYLSFFSTHTNRLSPFQHMTIMQIIVDTYQWIDSFKRYPKGVPSLCFLVNFFKYEIFLKIIYSLYIFLHWHRDHSQLNYGSLGWNHSWLNCIQRQTGCKYVPIEQAEGDLTYHPWPDERMYFVEWKKHDIDVIALISQFFFSGITLGTWLDVVLVH